MVSKISCYLDCSLLIPITEKLTTVISDIYELQNSAYGYQASGHQKLVTKVYVSLHLFLKRGFALTRIIPDLN